MLKLGKVISDHFVEKVWSFYNWLQGGFIHLTLTEFDNLDNKLYDGFNVITSEMQKIDAENKEMQNIGGGRRVN